MQPFNANIRPNFGYSISVRNSDVDLSFCEIRMQDDYKDIVAAGTTLNAAETSALILALQAIQEWQRVKK